MSPFPRHFLHSQLIDAVNKHVSVLRNLKLTQPYLSVGSDANLSKSEYFSDFMDAIALYLSIKLDDGIHALK